MTHSCTSLVHLVSIIHPKPRGSIGHVKIMIITMCCSDSRSYVPAHSSDIGGGTGLWWGFLMLSRRVFSNPMTIAESKHHPPVSIYTCGPEIWHSIPTVNGGESFQKSLFRDYRNLKGSFEAPVNTQQRRPVDLIRGCALVCLFLKGVRATA